VGLAGVLPGLGLQGVLLDLVAGGAPQPPQPLLRCAASTPTRRPAHRRPPPPRCHRRPAAGRRLKLASCGPPKRQHQNLQGLLAPSTAPRHHRRQDNRRRRRQQFGRAAYGGNPIQTSLEHQETFRYRDIRLSKPRTSHPRPADKQRSQTRDASDHRIAPGCGRARCECGGVSPLGLPGHFTMVARALASDDWRGRTDACF
jgi:hypothetical protein